MYSEDETSTDSDVLLHTNRLPGVKILDHSMRKVRPRVLSRCVRWSPTARTWGCASNEGLMLWTQKDGLTFNPTELDMHITPKSFHYALARKAYAEALSKAFRLNLSDLIKEAIERTPPSEIQITIRNLPTHHVPKVLTFLAKGLASTRFLEFYVLWIQTILSVHAYTLRTDYSANQSTFRHLQNGLSKTYKDLSSLAQENLFRMDYLLGAGDATIKQSEKKQKEVYIEGSWRPRKVRKL